LRTSSSGHIFSYREAFEASRARETVLEIKLKGMEDAASRTRLRAGFTVNNLNTHVFGTVEMVEKAAAAEALTASKGLFLMA